MTPETWFRGLISQLARELRLDVDIAGLVGAPSPNDAMGQRLQRFMREVVGTQISKAQQSSSWTRSTAH